jgi:CxxC motif-containing protein (DUF1111 family)
MRPAIRTGALRPAPAWLLVLCFASFSSLCPRPARSADPVALGDKKARAIAQGRELFTHQCVPHDVRSRGGDGLGPVYNERSCLGCHHQGPSGAGGGSAGTNIELIAPTGGSDPPDPQGFISYAFAFNYGPGGFTYRIENPV